MTSDDDRNRTNAQIRAGADQFDELTLTEMDNDMNHMEIYSEYVSTEMRTDAAGASEQIARRHAAYAKIAFDESGLARATRRRHSSIRQRLERIASHPLVQLGSQFLVAFIG